MLKDSQMERAGLSRTHLNNNYQSSHARNPFESPNLSTSSLNDTDDGSTSGQDEFHLERYSENSKYQHLRQISRSTNGEEKDRKPDLNIITTFTGPNMPMKAQAVLVNEVPAKRVSSDRKDKTVSVVSHKAVRAMATPTEPPNRSLEGAGGLKKLRLPSRVSRRGDSLRQLHNAVKQRQKQKKGSPLTQHIPIGITIPKEDAARVNDTVTDSALPMATPMTPAIIVTPAGNQQPWTLQRHGTSDFGRPASSIYSAYPTENPAFMLEEAPPLPRSVHHVELQTPQHESATSQQESVEDDRHKSQGWWNLMLSPLLRNGSLASRKGFQATDTPPVPPLPFTSEKHQSPAVSVRSDPSLLLSPNDTSPDTPRRQGLASARASTWSRWTEWEEERELNAQKALEDEKTATREPNEPVLGKLSSGPGLAAEYFHACAVEQATGQPYFECINHSCAEQLPKLRSVHDKSLAGPVLGSPFESPLGENRGLEIGGHEGNDGSATSKPEGVSSSDELSPNVRQATTATFVKARPLEEIAKGVQPGPKRNSQEEQRLDPFSEAPAAHPVERHNVDFSNNEKGVPQPQVIELKITQQSESPPSADQSSRDKSVILDNKTARAPSPLSPEGEKFIAPVGAVPLTDMDNKQPHHAAPVMFIHNPYAQGLPPRPAFISADTEYPALPERAPTAPVTAADLRLTSRRLSLEEQRRQNEKEDATAKKVGGLWRGRGCFPKNGCMSRGGPESRARRRWVFGISFLLLVIVIACIILAVTLTRHGDGTPIDSQWLNLTGYPPMPIGILTIAAPNLVASQKQCVTPSSMWSCSVPKDDHNQIGANGFDQPNVRFEIKFRNGTVPANMTIPLDGKSRPKSSKDPFTNDLFVANPTAPNQPDQVFLGQSTDNITAPFDGEQTPFYITFMSAFPEIPSSFNNTGSARLVKKSDNSSDTAIPAPALDDDGSAAPATLLPTEPFPISQPVRLYNRGLQDEHYGFYMYYDKSIYLSGIQIVDDSATNGSSQVPEADQDGGCLKSQANSVCTFAQTRFLFKAFTNAAFGGTVLPSTTNVNLTAPEDAKKQEKTSSATNFDRPGSFPYPTTMAVDRHGGDIDKKQIYCYGMRNGDVIQDEKMPVIEFRGVGGQTINPAPNVLGDDNGFNSTAGGIDGGTAGCFCNWQNWE